MAILGSRLNPTTVWAKMAQIILIITALLFATSLFLVVTEHLTNFHYLNRIIAWRDPHPVTVCTQLATCLTGVSHRAKEWAGAPVPPTQ